MDSDEKNKELDIPGSQECKSLGRRLLLKAVGVFSVLITVPSSLWAFFIEKLGIRTVEKDTFAFEYSSKSIFWKPKKTHEPYCLFVGGLVDKKIELTYQELMKLPQVAQISDFHCVEGWSVKDIKWGGIRFEEIVKIAKPAPEAKYVIFHSLGETDDPPQGQYNYVECFTLNHLLDPKKECLLTLTMNGKPLPHDHGAPLRVISPYDLGYKNIKFVYRMDFVKEERSGWWSLANPPMYPVNAPVPSSRLRRK
jgi:DMSO/TMAO reductase YedYZ molybdopterin-dependent catalytic subunit